jgi:hypothetical protein
MHDEGVNRKLHRVKFTHSLEPASHHSLRMQGRLSEPVSNELHQGPEQIVVKGGFRYSDGPSTLSPYLCVTGVAEMSIVISIVHR